ncbi:ADP-ribosylglycohydrolase family protein [Nocardia puris]|uniref:ADP-ribosylglycohydrolase family protein n=1 Tax=Nocardia puris TaxID=208602 RepID=UPI00189340CE|nr:ADP-ribosylglycohydrolase family protein [Nocardia puris]MBF6369638.1 ADP-ribosylglycohydrolase family protein [Nocardia puris]MBF6462547.1 ADP-ribosylglycohydrolase family protein [Nocardia puris]
MTTDRLARAVASLRGLAVGDAFGANFFVPANLPALRERTLPPPVWPWTDDTEMACSVVTVLARLGTIEQDALAASFAERHDFDRGYGPGVNRMLRLIRQEGGNWRTLATDAFGGQGSWGNGAAMRVAPIGAYFADDLDRVVAESAASAEVTHAHPEGVAGAVAVGLATALRATEPELRGPEFLDAVAARTPAGAVHEGILAARALAGDPEAAAAALGNGRDVSAPDTVPFCLWVAAHHLDFATANWVTASVGGDVDTTCAIVGGILGESLVPAAWRASCEELPDWSGVRLTGA